MSHFLSVEIRFAPLVVYDYSRLYIGFILFYIRMCIRHTEYIYMVCNLCFYASKNQSYEILALHVYSMLVGTRMATKSAIYLICSANEWYRNEIGRDIAGAPQKTL